jgi:hypothetical protein
MKEKKNKLYLAEPLIRVFNEPVNQVYVPGEFISVDEETLKFKGQTTMKQFTKDKRHRFGFKIFTANESSGYCFKVKVYAGKGSIIPPPHLLQTEFVVLDLLSGLENRGYKPWIWLGKFGGRVDEEKVRCLVYDFTVKKTISDRTETEN